MKEVHEKNVARLKQIIAKNGWPGISLVGKEAAKSAWLIVQHAISDPEFMSNSEELLIERVYRNDIEGWQLAFLQDRIQTMAGKEQIYGTQFDIDSEGWPFVENESELFLKTIIPSRKATRQYVGGSDE